MLFVKHQTWLRDFDLILSVENKLANLNWFYTGRHNSNFAVCKYMVFATKYNPRKFKGFDDWWHNLFTALYILSEIKQNHISIFIFHRKHFVNRLILFVRMVIFNKASPSKLSKVDYLFCEERMIKHNLKTYTQSIHHGKTKMEDDHLNVP